MPVEIKKLVVKALILNHNHDKGMAKMEKSVVLSNQEKQLIIEESVNQVMSILERKKNR